MKVGDLVKMTDDPSNILGVITETIDDTHRNDRVYYKVSWLCHICDPSYADEDVLELISESG